LTRFKLAGFKAMAALIRRSFSDSRDIGPFSNKTDQNA
jgi:hypothetical protein